MFKCAFCSRDVGPRVSPIKVVLPTDVRAVKYSNMVSDSDGEVEERRPKMVLKETYGTEFVAEYNQCPTCAGVKVEDPKMEVVPRTLSEPLARPFTQPMAALVADRLVGRHLQECKTVRSQADLRAAAMVIKGYEARGGKVA